MRNMCILVQNKYNSFVILQKIGNFIFKKVKIGILSFQKVNNKGIITGAFTIAIPKRLQVNAPVIILLFTN